MVELPQRLHAFFAPLLPHEKARIGQRTTEDDRFVAFSSYHPSILNYYIILRSQAMLECTIPSVPPAEEDQNNVALPDDELVAYASQCGASGFQGGLNYY